MDRAAEVLRLRHGHPGLSTGGDPIAGSGFDAANEGADDAPPVRRVFVRKVAAPPALPWDQARAALLEAQLNAPLPADQLAFQIRRLTPLQLGGGADFLATYVRKSDAENGLEEEVEVDGRRLTVRFAPPGERERRLRQIAAVAAGVGAATFLAVITVAAVVSARTEAATRLEALETTVARRLAIARRDDQIARESAALVTADLAARRGGRVVADLDWVARSRTGDARIEGFVWQGGLTAVEVRGPNPPFRGADREARRVDQPVRAGVWLWGVQPAVAGATAP